MQVDPRTLQARIRALEAELESERRRRLAVEAELDAERAEHEEIRLAAQRAGIKLPAGRPPLPQGRTVLGLLVVAVLVIFSLHGLLASRHNCRLRHRLRRALAHSSAPAASGHARTTESDDDPQLRAAHLAFSAGAFSRARSLAARVTARHPKLVRGWVLLGLSSCYRGAVTDARRAYRRLAQLAGHQERRLATVCGRHGVDVTE